MDTHDEPYGLIVSDFDISMDGLAQVRERMAKLIDRNVTLEAKFDIANEEILLLRSRASTAEIELKHVRALLKASGNVHPAVSDGAGTLNNVPQEDNHVTILRANPTVVDEDIEMLQPPVMTADPAFSEARSHAIRGGTQATGCSERAQNLAVKPQTSKGPNQPDAHPRKIRKRHHPRETFSRGSLVIAAEDEDSSAISAGTRREALPTRLLVVPQDAETIDTPPQIQSTATNRQARRRGSDTEDGTKGSAQNKTQEVSVNGIYVGGSGYPVTIGWQFLPEQVRAQVTKLFSDLDVTSSPENLQHYTDMLENPSNDGDCVSMRLRKHHHPTNAKDSFGGPLVACCTCTNKAIPCVRIHSGKMTVVALPSSEIPAGMAVTNTAFWVKEKSSRTPASIWKEGGKRKSSTDSDEAEDS